MLIIKPPFFIKPKIELLKKQINSIDVTLNPSQEYVLKKNMIRLFLAKHHAFRIYMGLNAALWGMFEECMDMYAQKLYFDSLQISPK